MWLDRKARYCASTPPRSSGTLAVYSGKTTQSDIQHAINLSQNTAHHFLHPLRNSATPPTCAHTSPPPAEADNLICRLTSDRSCRGWPLWCFDGSRHAQFGREATLRTVDGNARGGGHPHRTACTYTPQSSRLRARPPPSLPPRVYLAHTHLHTMQFTMPQDRLSSRTVASTPHLLSRRMPGADYEHDKLTLPTLPSMSDKRAVQCRWGASCRWMISADTARIEDHLRRRHTVMGDALVRCCWENCSILHQSNAIPSHLLIDHIMPELAKWSPRGAAHLPELALPALLVPRGLPHRHYPSTSPCQSHLCTKQHHFGKILDHNHDPEKETSSRGGVTWSPSEMTSYSPMAEMMPANWRPSSRRSSLDSCATHATLDECSRDVVTPVYSPHFHHEFTKFDLVYDSSQRPRCVLNCRQSFGVP